MSFKIPLWIMIPCLMGLTGLYLVIPNFGYTKIEWIIGNGIVVLGVGVVYISENIYKRVKK